MKKIFEKHNADSKLIESLYCHNGFNFVVVTTQQNNVDNLFCQLSGKFVDETYSIDIDEVGTLTIDVSYCFDDLYYSSNIPVIDCEDFIRRYKELFPEKCNQYN